MDPQGMSVFLSEISKCIDGGAIEVCAELENLQKELKKLADACLSKREQLICRIVEAYLAGRNSLREGLPLGGTIEERRTICMLAGQWADSIQIEAASPGSGGPPWVN